MVVVLWIAGGFDGQSLPPVQLYTSLKMKLIWSAVMTDVTLDHQARKPHLTRPSIRILNSYGIDGFIANPQPPSAVPIKISTLESASDQ